MSRMIKRAGVVTMVILMVLIGSAWAGWFTFEPNLVLLDGTHVSVTLEDITKEDGYLKEGDMEQANQLVKDSKIFIKKKNITKQDLLKGEFAILSKAVQ